MEFTRSFTRIFLELKRTFFCGFNRSTQKISIKQKRRQKISDTFFSFYCCLRYFIEKIKINGHEIIWSPSNILCHTFYTKKNRFWMILKIMNSFNINFSNSASEKWKHMDLRSYGKKYIAITIHCPNFFFKDLIIS